PVDLWVSATGLFAVHADGPEPLVTAEVMLADRTARELGGEAVPHAPPPRVVSRPHERAVPLETIDAELLAPPLVGDAIPVVGWHVGGACVIDTARPPLPPPTASPLLRALKRRLDPQG